MDEEKPTGFTIEVDYPMESTEETVQQKQREDGNDDDDDDTVDEDATSDDEMTLKRVEDDRSDDLLETVAREKEAMEKYFDVKRARFVELFKQKEIELSESRKTGDDARRERDDLLLQVRRIQDELDECKSQVTIAECTAENMVDEEKRKCRDEIASLQQIIKESMAETALVNNKYDSEISRLKKLNERLDAEVQELKTTSMAVDSSKEGVLSAMTKTLAKRVSSLNAYSQSAENVHENLEEGMKKAQEDAEVLRSLVVPLEEEIKALKEKLRAADDQLRSYEGNALTTSVVSDISADSSVGQQRTVFAEGENQMDEKLKELHKGLQAEKSSRSDLEMYVSVLQSQKAMLQTEADGLRKELGEVCQLLDKEKREHRELKQTWQMANDKFLECQKVQSDDLRRIQRVLTAEQQKAIAEDFQKKDSGEEGVNDSLSSRLQSSLRKSPSPARQSATSVAVDDVNRSPLEAESSLEGGRRDTWIRRAQMESASSMDSIDEQHLLPSTTSVTGADIARLLEDEDCMYSQSHAKRPVGEKAEIQLLQEELRCLRERSSKPKLCDMCPNYETQLQRAQECIVELQRKVKSLEESNKWHLVDLRDEQIAKQKLEEKLLHVTVEMQEQLAELYKKTEETERMHSEARRACSEYVQWAKSRFLELSTGRDEMQAELDRLQRLSDTLVGKYSAHSQQMQSEAINLPDAIEDMQLLLLRLQEDLIVAKVAKEHLEETLRSEILFLKERVIGEQQSRESNEHVLTQECDSLRQQVAILESIKEQLSGEQTRRAEAERSVRDLQKRFTENQAKHRQISMALTKKHEDCVKTKERLEEELAQFRMKVQTLQTDLDNSEAVQRDFVKLSQSLQVQLEKIRESEKEVRWQHEEDVNDCSNCKQTFSVTRRRHHCRHCGRIFCADCTSKVVLSGPIHRPSKVCDVCHTLLVPDTAPYFSSAPD